MSGTYRGEIDRQEYKTGDKTLSGSIGPSGIDSISISIPHWQMKLGGASARLRKSIASMVE